MVRFRIWHLFVLVAIVAILSFAGERYSRRNVVVEIWHAQTWTDSDRTSIDVDGDYAIYFKLYDDPEWPAECMAIGKYGYNPLFDKKVTANSLKDVSNVSLNVTLRRSPYPWSEVTNINDELSKHFEFVNGLPETEHNSHAHMPRTPGKYLVLCKS